MVGHGNGAAQTPTRAAMPYGASGPELQFGLVGAESLEPAAVPTLKFTLAIAAPGHQVRSILLDVQIQIAARLRAYPPEAQQRLLELFGTPDRWGTTLRTLPWTRVRAIVPPFAQETTIDLQVPLTYDLEVIAARYLAALDDGEVPLEFLFSGSVFFTSRQGLLQTTRIAWDREVQYGLPVSLWRAAMDRHFPDSAWLRLGQEAFARLSAYKAQGAYASWDEAVAALLAGSDAS